MMQKWKRQSEQARDQWIKKIILLFVNILSQSGFKTRQKKGAHTNTHTHNGYSFSRKTFCLMDAVRIAFE